MTVNKKSHLLLRGPAVLLACALAAAVLQPQAAARPADNELSPGEAYAAMDFGVFMHYGLATLVGRTPWDYDPHNIPATVYDPPDFDPDQWMDAIAASGAEFIIFTAKHHDGFVMWPSEYTGYGVHNSADPHTDVVGEVVEAARERDLKVVLYYSWFDKMEPGGFVTRNPGRITNSPDYLAYAKNQLTELLTDYGHIEGVWLDIGPYDDVQLPELADHVHDLSPGTALIPNFPNKLSTPVAADVRSFVDDDLLCTYEGPAEEDFNMSAGPAWWQASDRPPRADVDEAISRLSYTRYLDAVLALNISPGPSGQMPPASVQLLEAIGDRVDGDNLLADANATASGDVPEHGAGHATDLRTQTYWQSDDDNAWLQVDLDQPVTINRSVVQFTTSDAVSGYEVQYRDADGTWRAAYAGGVPSFPTQTDEFQAVTTSSLRLVVEGAADDAGVIEFKAYGGIDDAMAAATYTGDGWQALARPDGMPDDVRLPPRVPWAEAFNESIHRSRHAGDTATFTFAGNGVELHTSTGPDQGTARVSVDGREPELIDLYQAEPGRDEISYRRDDLLPGQHTLTVEVTGDHHEDSTGSWVSVDRLIPLNVPAPFDPGGHYEVLPDGRLIYDDSTNQCSEDSAIQYAGTWQSQGANGAHNRTRHISRTAGSYAELTFEGSGVAVMAQTRPGHGIAAISVDGGEPELVDTYSDSRQEQVVIWEQTGLSPGEHTIRIEVTGDQNPAAHNAWIGLDAIIVTP